VGVLGRIAGILLWLPGSGRLGAAGLAALLWLGIPATGDAETTSGEYTLKAAFVLNIARFVDWPESAFKNSGEFCIGSLGRSPMDRELAALAGKNVKGRTVVFRQFNTPEAAAQCQVLFVKRGEAARLVSLLSALKDAPVLTVSDQEAFCSYGGTVGLVNEQGRIAFEVNLAERVPGARLSYSSQLLKLARRVYGRH
jgi:hypothetical protein